jgi:hypothetical protein
MDSSENDADKNEKERDNIANHREGIMIKWRPLLMGVAIALLLYIPSSMVFSQNSLLSDFLLAGIAVGLMLGVNIKNGVVNGAIMGVIAAIIVAVMIVILFSAEGASFLVLGAILGNMVIYLLMAVVLALVGGAMGSWMRAEAAVH